MSAPTNFNTLYRIPRLPPPTYDHIRRLCKEHGLTQWQVIIMFSETFALLTKEAIKSQVADVKKRFLAP